VHLRYWNLKLIVCIKMAKRFNDSRIFLLGSAPTSDDKVFPTSKLPTNKQVIFSFIVRKEEEYSKLKTKKSMFKAALLTVTESILPIQQSQDSNKKQQKISQEIISIYDQMQNIMKIKKKKREFGKPRERINAFKKS